MAQYVQWFEQDFDNEIKIRHCESVMFTGDNEGALIGVRLFVGGVAYSGGGTVAGAIKRSDGGRVAVTGTLTGNAASIVIPGAALAYGGTIGVQIRIDNDDQKATVLKAIYNVDDTSGIPVDPGHLVPDYDELIAEIDNMREATAAAVAATTAAETATSGANTAAAAANAAAGSLHNMDATASNVPNSGGQVGQATAEVTTVNGHYRIALGIPVGIKGDTGAGASVLSQETGYQVGDSGTTEPTGTWQTTIPTVPQGKFLWIKRVVEFNDGSIMAVAIPSRQGIDGSGAVSTVNGISPDSNGNVSLGELVKSVNNLPPPPGGNGNINLPIDDAPTTNSSNPVKSGALKTALDAKADGTELAKTNGALAIVQTGDNATQTIDAGALVLWKGDLYTADASIPSGDPFATSGGSKNLSAVSNGGLNALNNKIDNPKNIYRYTLSANTQKTFSISNGARLMVTTFDSTANRCGMWFIISTGTGNVSQKEIVAASDITINTATTNALKVTSPGTTIVMFEELRGNDISAYVS